MMDNKPEFDAENQKKSKVKKTFKVKEAEPSKSKKEDGQKKESDVLPRTLSDEEWELVFQSALDRVMNTPLDQLLPQDEELVQTGTCQDKRAGVDMDDRTQDDQLLTHKVDTQNIKQDVVGEAEEQESSENHSEQDRPHPMVECANVQELNENTPEGSELEFSGEEKTEHATPVVVVKKVKKADRSSAAKALAPRQLHFPKLEVHAEKDKKKKVTVRKDIINDRKEKTTAKKDGMKQKKEKMLGIKEKTDVIKKKKGISKDSEIKKDSIKSLPQKSRKQRLMEREIEATGTWVQCSNTSCKKWRFLPDINDPTEIDEKWVCGMNTDTAYDSCDKGEQDYDESEHIYTRYSEGSVVWARMTGYPWWPAMVEIDPDTESYFELTSQDHMFPSHYHVVYLDNKVSRAWVKASSVLPFKHRGEDLNRGIYLTKKSKGPNFKKEVDLAANNARIALDLPLKERLKQFGFSSRFKGKWGQSSSEDEGKMEKHCRVRLTPKKGKKKSKKTREPLDTADLAMFMLDTSTVDEILSQQSDSVLKEIENVLDSLGSQSFKDDNDEEDYKPTNTECQEFTESTELTTSVSRGNTNKGTKRRNSNNIENEEKSISKKAKRGLENMGSELPKGSKEKKAKKIKASAKTTNDDNQNADTSTALLEKKAKKVAKKIKKSAANTTEYDTPAETSTVLASVKPRAVPKPHASKTVISHQAEVHCSAQDKVSDRQPSTTTVKFDSEIFTMELECENPQEQEIGLKQGTIHKVSKQKSKKKANTETDISKKKSKKSLFAVPPINNVEKTTSVNTQSAEANGSETSTVDSPSTPATNEQCTTKSHTTQHQPKVKPLKKSSAKKVSFSAPTTVCPEPKVSTEPEAVEPSCAPAVDEQTVPDTDTQESQHDDDFSLDIPVCVEVKTPVQEFSITAVSTLPAAIDTTDAYDSDPFDMMEE